MSYSSGLFCNAVGVFAQPTAMPAVGWPCLYIACVMLSSLRVITVGVYDFAFFAAVNCRRLDAVQHFLGVVRRFCVGTVLVCSCMRGS